ncbi:MAG: hypothetical protein O3C28_06950 [Proteobacteria bacterium]|nr:hypothetical protein [Pseudomonadota bacterium]
MPHTRKTSELSQLIQTYLDDTNSSFSIGAFGAVAEFFRSATEACLALNSEPLTCATSRGGIRIRMRGDVRVRAYEMLTTHPQRWLHGVALCLPECSARGAGRSVITELGPDCDAIREQDFGGTLFDVGLRLANGDFLVRSNDPAVISALRKFSGSHLLDADLKIMDFIVDASPHRVVTSSLGRIEVYQTIDRHQTPDGPHTHVLPKLLRCARAYDAKIPIEHNYLPCLNLYPPNPLTHNNGESVGYQHHRHLAFQSLLNKWGCPEYVTQKRELLASLRNNTDPATFAFPSKRIRRSAVRIALRQGAFDKSTMLQAQKWTQYFHKRRNAEEFLDE